MSEKHFLGNDVTICASVHLCAHEPIRCDVARSSTTVVNLCVQPCFDYAGRWVTPLSSPVVWPILEVS